MRKINNSANIFNIIDIAHTAFSIDDPIYELYCAWEDPEQ